MYISSSFLAKKHVRLEKEFQITNFFNVTFDNLDMHLRNVFYIIMCYLDQETLC